MMSNCDCLMCVVFFFKQKTAYEMRISDWSSDVCSSDLNTSVMRILTAGLSAAALACGLTLAPPAFAQSQISSVCGVTGAATAPASITYDPFSPGGLSEATVPLILRRNRGLILGRTRQVSLEIGRASFRERVCQYV